MDLKRFIHFSDKFIETGTHRGEGVQRALSAGFTKILSIELDKNHYTFCLKRFLNDQRVRLFKGVSYEVLPKLLEEINYPCVFFLDAHPSGPGTAGHDELMSGDKTVHQDVIIKKELAVILAHRNDHVILIDDMNGEDDFVREYRRIISSVNQNYKFELADQIFHDVQYKEKVLIAIP